MAFDASAVYASRNTRLYRAPYAHTNALPAHGTHSFGTAWGGTFVDMGYTQEGVTVTMTVDRDEINVDQELDAVLYPFSGRDIRMSGIMAEYTADHLKFSMGQGTTSTQAGTVGTARGYNEYSLVGDPVDSFSTWGLEFQKNDDTEALQAVVWKAQTVTQGETVFGISGTNLQLPFEVRAMPDTANVGAPRRILTIRELTPIPTV